MGKIGIISDDLTGGTTVGTLMARSDIKTTVYFSSQEMPKADEQEAVVLTSDSRHLPAIQAQSAVYKCFQALKDSGVTYFSKRTDTTLRGGIGYEIDEMLRHMSDDTVAVMVPAMPQSNRIVVGGYSVIEGQALSETDVSKDVLTPVTESNIPKMLLKQSRYKIGELDLGTVLAGKEVIKDVLKGRKAEGCKIILCDSINLEQITRIAEAVNELNWNTLAVDPGPFTQELAITRGFGKRKEEIPSDNEEITLNVQTKVLVVAGSATKKTKTQLNELNKYNNSTMISADPNNLVNTQIAQSEIDTIHQLIKNKLNTPDTNVAIIETAASKPVLDLKHKEDELNLQTGEASKNINLGLADIVEKTLNDATGIGGLYLTGGDTMVTTLKSLKAKGIQLIDYVIPQTDLGRIVGGPYEGLLTIGKGGLTGNLFTAVKAVNKICEEYRKENAPLMREENINEVIS